MNNNHERCIIFQNKEKEKKVANVVPSALTAKGAPIVNLIVNPIAGIKLSQSQALN